MVKQQLKCQDRQKNKPDRQSISMETWGRYCVMYEAERIVCEVIHRGAVPCYTWSQV